MRSKTMSYAVLASLAATVFMAPRAEANGFIFVDPVFHGAPPAPILTPVTPPTTTTPIRPGVRTPRPNTPLLRGSVSTGLSLGKQEISVEIDNNVAKTYIKQTFNNDTDRDLAGTYLFPLPQDATFSSFSLHIDGKPIEGKILAAGEARAQYEQIVRSMVDPGLLEYADYKTVRARIFPIPKNGSKTVELEYTQLVKADGGMFKYKFPLKSADCQAVDATEILLKLKSKEELRTIWSPTYTINTVRKDGHDAKVSFSNKGDPLDKDFTVYYTVSDKELSAALLAHKGADEDGYFLMTLNPPFTAPKVVNKDIVLVADTSGSMLGEKLDQTKQALKFIVNSLNAGDRFSIVQFNTDAESFNSQLLEATAENKKKAVEFIEDLEPHGGTNIGAALSIGEDILNAKTDEARPAYLVLMTDGQPTVGATDTAALLKTVKSKRDIRLFDFGVGFDVNTQLLNKLASEHHGTSQYVEPDENLETVLSVFYTKIKSPVLSDVKIAYNGIEVKDIYPKSVTDIFAGSPVMLMGRYKEGSEATVNLTGKVNGTVKTFNFPMQFAKQETGYTYLPRLWAMRRIGYLTEVAQQNDENKEIVDEIVELSKRYGIISAYTSFLVTDPNEQNTFRNARNRDFGRPFPPGAPVLQGATNGTVGPMTSRPVRGRLLSSRNGLPATSLDAFVASAGGRAEAVFGDEGSASGGLPAYFEFSKAHRVAMSTGTKGLPPVNWGKSVHSPGDNQYAASAGAGGRKQAAQMITGHGSYVPDAWGGDEFSDGAGWSTSGSAGKAKEAFSRALAKAATSGEKAVLAQKSMNELKSVDTIASAQSNSSVKVIGDKTFYFMNGFWVDSSFEKLKDPKCEEVEFGSKKYFDLVQSEAGLVQYLGAGQQVIVVYKGRCYKIVAPANVG